MNTWFQIRNSIERSTMFRIACLKLSDRRSSRGPSPRRALRRLALGLILAGSICSWATAQVPTAESAQPPRMLTEGAPPPAYWGNQNPPQAAPPTEARQDWPQTEPYRLQRIEHQEAAPAEVRTEPEAQSPPLTPQRETTIAPQGRPPRSGLYGGNVSALATAGGSLAIVVGLFLLVAWVVRRGMPRNAALLPTSAVEVLGRAPLIGKQQVHLVRCGNKILLLDASPSGVKTLTEITDPAEVDRLQEICQSPHSRSGSSFSQVFTQYDRQPRETDYPLQQVADEMEFEHMAHLRGRASHA
jgi:flagellar biogenesis protein FliO